MNFVEPIRDRDKLAQIKTLLREQERYRDLLLFTVGINSSLRISDLLSLQVGMFIDEYAHIKQHLWLKERRPDRQQEIIINDAIRDALSEYIIAYPKAVALPNNYLFYSTRNTHPIYSQPLQRNRAWEIISGVCRDVGLNGNYGTHSLRKTWGYHARMNGVGMELIMEKLNHNSLTYTKSYLGITNAELAEITLRLNL